MSETIDFWEASEADIPTIRAIADVSFRDTYKDIISPEQLEWMLDWMYSPESLQKQFAEGDHFFIMNCDGVPSGYISIERMEESLFYIHKIYLLPSCKGRGLGRKLMEHGLEYVRSFGLPEARVELNVNRQNPAVHFYKAVGFRILSSRDTEIFPTFFMNDYIMSTTVRQ